MILSLEYHRSPARYLAARTLSGSRLGSRVNGAVLGNVSPLRLVNRPEPTRPAEGWTRVRPLLSGICGSDLAMLTGRSSTYLEPITSMPFVPGHEVVGETLDELPDLPRGSRVVLDPVLGCGPRGTEPCRWCAEGKSSRCDHVTTGQLGAGLQTGFCADTGGGWSTRMLAHRSQLHAVPDALPSEKAVLVEPLSCAVHAVRRVEIPPDATVVVIGAGTVGLFTVLALRNLTEAGSVYAVAKHGHQQAHARALGATSVLTPDRATRALRRITTARMHTPERGQEFLLGGADVVFECTGGAGGLDMALRLARAGGTVVLSGMPGAGTVDLTPLWFRELNLVGAYASDHGGGRTSGDFAEAIRLAGEVVPDGYVEPPYPLGRWREALNHAGEAGRLGSVKIVFDPNRE